MKIYMILPLQTNAGNTSSPSHRKDAERPNYVLHSNFHDLLLCCHLWILDIWEQIQLKHSQKSDAGRGTFFGTSVGFRPRHCIHSPSTLCHWPGNSSTLPFFRTIYEVYQNLDCMFIVTYVIYIYQVYSQVAYEIMEKKSADVNQGMFSKRNLIPRLFLRTLYVIVCGFFAAMLPFFGDINGVVGAIGFIPLDFVLPMLLYNMTYKPTKSSAAYWINNSIIVVFTCVGIMGAFSSIRKLVQDAAEFKLFSSDVVD